MIPAAEHAYSHAKRLILSGEAPGGTLLSEAQLGAEIGVSRTPVHEAFLRLAAEGLLTLEPRRGAIVVPMSPREAQNVLDLREAIEATAAARVRDGGGADEVLRSALEEALAEQRAAIATGDVERFVEADQWFHAAVVDASGNDLACHFYGLLRDRQQRIRHQLFRVRPETLGDSLADHEALLDALRSGGDYPELLRTHIARNQGAL
ncbi:GntR family transcriptional regulator [Leifsonia aquatica]|uniref:Transcriptional regulator, GntR family n=2 Tax=Leifsonia aquatica TaxID=144185 RepID=U2RTC0_LEIAQ|nr:GntR family transcriptional regulator [Leifsonia aquatica]ERK72021.1 transcriptional regulator, GntR family [Leifsonia aquatica ATCC 14665]MBB2969404.1 DNA-binding GntR family transcriptional regulator [Leifsonia aquatica]